MQNQRDPNQGRNDDVKRVDTLASQPGFSGLAAAASDHALDH